MPDTFSDTPLSSNTINYLNKVTPPQGWSVATAAATAPVQDTKDDVAKLKGNLELVATKALKIIEEIQTRANINIPEAYLRIEQQAVFHVLLFVHQEGYLSPHMSIAKIITENYIRAEDRFDVRFSFTNLDENNTRRSEVIEDGYRLKHIEMSEDQPEEFRELQNL